MLLHGGGGHGGLFLEHAGAGCSKPAAAKDNEENGDEKERALVARPRAAEVEAVLTVKVHWVPLREQEDPESAITPGGGLREQTELAAYCEVQGSGTHTVLRTLLVVFVKPTQAQPPPKQDEHAEEDW